MRLWAHRKARLKKITVLSSSMVFENAVVFPRPKANCVLSSAQSTYGFQKLAVEYFARGACNSMTSPIPSAARSTA